MKSPTQIRILAVASAGGHWVQLRRLAPAWKGCCVTYVTTSESRRNELLHEDERQENNVPVFYAVMEASRWNKCRLFVQFVQILFILCKVRPHIVISTGAAPGFFALRIGKLLQARTIWVDSIANAEELSLSGRKVRTCADLWLTQWEHLSGPDAQKKPRYMGTVI
jgi:UDP-N-acetylglucosamine:LPS N-acetylglucosamine transferase